MRRDPRSATRPPGHGQPKRLGTASEQGPIVQVLLPSNAAGDTATGYLRVDPTVFHASSSLRVATVNGVALPPGNRGRTPHGDKDGVGEAADIISRIIATAIGNVEKIIPDHVLHDAARRSALPIPTNSNAAGFRVGSKEDMLNTSTTSDSRSARVDGTRKGGVANGVQHSRTNSNAPHLQQLQQLLTTMPAGVPPGTPLLSNSPSTTFATRY
mgnify:CR=1 FL=1